MNNFPFVQLKVLHERKCKVNQLFFQNIEYIDSYVCPHSPHGYLEGINTKRYLHRNLKTIISFNKTIKHRPFRQSLNSFTVGKQYFSIDELFEWSHTTPLQKTDLS